MWKAWKVFLDMNWWLYCVNESDVNRLSLHMWHTIVTYFKWFYRGYDTMWHMLHCENGVFVSHDWSLFRGCPYAFWNVNIENQSEVKDLTKSIKFKIDSFTKCHVIISCDAFKSRGGFDHLILQRFESHVTDIKSNIF